MFLKFIILLLIIMFPISVFANDEMLELKKAILQERLARLQAEYILTQEQLKQIEAIFQEKKTEIQNTKQKEVVK